LRGYKWWSCEIARCVAKRCKSILHRFYEPTGEYLGYTLNPYVGCAHRCVYCYATYEWAENFYDEIKVKVNAVEALVHDIIREGKRRVDHVLISSATDCYQPLEGRYGLTRRCVEVLQRHGIPYTIITKSSTVLRDLELHRRYGDKCTIVFSLTTVDEGVKRMIEPAASSAESILRAVRIFSSNGVRVGVNIDPLIPGLNDCLDMLRDVVSKVSEAGACFVSAGMLRLRDDIWHRLKRLLISERRYDVVRVIEEVYFRYPVRLGYYYLAHPRYAAERLRYVRELAKEQGLKYGFGEQEQESTACYVKASQLAKGQRTITIFT